MPKWRIIAATALVILLIFLLYALGEAVKL